VIKAKYGIDELGRWSKKSSYSHSIGCWKSILAGLERFKSLVHFEMNDGSSKDLKCGFGRNFGFARGTAKSL